MSRFLTGNAYLFLAILCAAASQVLLKALLNQIGYFDLQWISLQRLWLEDRGWQLAAVAALHVAAALFWILSLRHLDLSYAYSIACGSAFIIAFLSVIFLNESVSPRMWFGIALIVFGTVLLVPQR